MKRGNGEPAEKEGDSESANSVELSKNNNTLSVVDTVTSHETVSLFSTAIGDSDPFAEDPEEGLFLKHFTKYIYVHDIM